MSVNVGTAMGYLDLDISGFLKQLKEAEDEATNASKDIAGNFGKSITSVGTSLTKTGTALTATITTPLAGMATSVISTGKEFNTAMSSVQAISGATGTEFQSLRDKAIELGEETVFSATEVANGMTEMAKAGWSSQQIMDGMSGVLNASSASGAELADVATIVADAITGFGMEASDATRVADLLTQAANAGTIDIADLGETFKYVAPLAQSSGYSIEDVTTAVSAMSMAGIKGSQAGTSLRATLLSMMDPTDEVAQAMNTLGIDLADSEGNMYSLDTVVGQLRNGFDGLTQEQKNYYASVLAGANGSQGLLAMLNLTEEEYNELSDSMNNCNGIAAETSEVMIDNLEGDMALLGSATETAKIKLNDMADEGMRGVTQKATELVNKFNDLTPEQQQQIVKWAGILAAIGPVLIILGTVTKTIGNTLTSFSKLKTGISNASKAFSLFKAGSAGAASSTSTLGTAMGALTGPLGIVLVVVGVLVAAFVNLWKNNEEFRDKMTAIWDQVKAKVQEAINRVKAIIERLKPIFEVVVNFLKTLWDGFCELLAPLFEGAFQIVADTFSAIVDVVLGILEFFIDLFSGDWDAAWEDIKGVFKAVWDWICNIFVSIWDTILGRLDTVCGWFGTTWENVWNSIKEFFVTVWTAISTFFSDLWDGIKSFVVEKVTNIKNSIVNTFTKVKDKITEIWNAVKKFFSDLWEAIVLKVKEKVERLKYNVITTFNNVKETVTTIFTNVKNKINEIWENIKTNITNKIENIKTKFTTVFTNIKTTITNIFTNIKDSIKEKLDAAKKTVTDVIDKIKEKFNFSWSLPKLKMPHVSISGKFSLSPLSVPKFSISWYKAAMDDGMILNSPTIFGYSAQSGNFLAGGEAGSETVVGTTSLLDMIKAATADAVGSLVDTIVETFNKLKWAIDELQEAVTSNIGSLLVVAQKYASTMGTYTLGGRPGPSQDYYALAQALAQVLRDSPFTPIVQVYMEDGDVVMDTERVGRKVAPVVSRIIVQSK